MRFSPPAHQTCRATVEASPQTSATKREVDSARLPSSPLFTFSATTLPTKKMQHISAGTDFESGPQWGGIADQHRQCHRSKDSLTRHHSAFQHLHSGRNVVGIGVGHQIHGSKCGVQYCILLCFTLRSVGHSSTVQQPLRDNPAPYIQPRVLVTATAHIMSTDTVDRTILWEASEQLFPSSESMQTHTDLLALSTL